MIPQDFESWKYCIEQKCGIPLTLPFVQSRLAVYENRDLPETQRFIRKYGESHYLHIREWFTRVAASQGVLYEIILRSQGSK